MRRIAIALSLTLVGLLPAQLYADSFGGFSGGERSYLVNQNRVCHPLKVADHSATGAPRCEIAAADVIARLSIKPPIVQSGAKATFTAQASGRTITVSRKTGAAIVAWDAPDPVIRVVEVYASQYDDRVAVSYIVRRAGKEVTDLVAFDLLGQDSAATVPPVAGAGGGAPSAGSGAPSAGSGAPSAGSASPPAPPIPADPRLVKAVDGARAAPRARALAAWADVLAVDPSHAEALYRTAAAQAAARHRAEAIAALESLAASPRPDAIEWQVEARFDAAFAALRADPKFRAAVGLDRPPVSTYERLMRFGGQWEQTGTSCDKPEVRLVTTRDRKFRLRVKTTCEGSVFDTPFRGTWAIDGDRLVLSLPNQGRVTAADEAGCTFEPIGDEDALRCALGRDLDFVVLPTRR